VRHLCRGGRVSAGGGLDLKRGHNQIGILLVSASHVSHSAPELAVWSVVRNQIQAI
jgi:hypothetical protein